MNALYEDKKLVLDNVKNGIISSETTQGKTIKKQTLKSNLKITNSAYTVKSRNASKTC